MNKIKKIMIGCGLSLLCLQNVYALGTTTEENNVQQINTFSKFQQKIDQGIKEALTINSENSRIIKKIVQDMGSSELYSFDSSNTLDDSLKKNSNLKFVKLIFTNKRRIFNYMLMYDIKNKFLLFSSTESIAGNLTEMKASIKNDLNEGYTELSDIPTGKFLTKKGFINDIIYNIDNNVDQGIKTYSFINYEKIK